jgi:site-specific DNA-cytosine methylase
MRVSSPVGSGCSGCDIQFYTLEQLSVCWTKRFDITVKFKLLFACENDPDKQRWLRRQRPDLTILFADMADLSNTRAHNIISGKPCVVPSVHIFVAGPVCTDRSRLNVNRAATVGCVQRSP